MGFDVKKLVRKNIRDLNPYSSARGEYTGDALIFLDANENAFGSPLKNDYHRYPDPGQRFIKRGIARMFGIADSQIFLGNGSDEAIDLLVRAFCRPGKDNIVICPPTYGMYEVAAAINETGVRRAPLAIDFDIDMRAIRKSINKHTKLIFLCSPNNPTGNLLNAAALLDLARSWEGIVIVDEAYIQFANAPSLISLIKKVPNLVVLQTFSKAWGLAGLRIGMAFGSREVIATLNRIKPPYNISQIAQCALIAALENQNQMEQSVAAIRDEREKLSAALQSLPQVLKVYPSDANFVLAKFTDAEGAYKHLLDCGIVVRDRSGTHACEDCLRITVGTADENSSLIEALKNL